MSGLLQIAKLVPKTDDHSKYIDRIKSTSLKTLKQSKMITISKDNQGLTLVNFFTVQPEKQDELLALLISCTDEFVSTCPGFISASYHKSLDGKNVVLYAQYENMEAFQGVINSEGGKRMVTEGSKLTESAQRCFCQVLDTREA